MPRKKKEVKEEVVVEEVVETPEVKDTKGVATVEWKGRSRDYTKELHGKDYKKLAEQFAGKVQGIVK